MKQNRLAAALAALLAAVLCGCGTAQPSMQMTLGNPVQSATWQQLCAELGTAPHLPPTAQEPVVQRYDLSPVLYEVTFCPAAGGTFTLRITPDPDAGDISGLYYEWQHRREYDNPACTLWLSETGQGVCLWQDGTFAYALSQLQDADEGTLLALCAGLQGR